MKRFRFRLEGLLRLRKVEEERRLRAFRAGQVALADVLARQHEIEVERDRTFDSLRRLETGQLEMHEIQRHRRYISALEVRERDLDAEMMRRRADLNGAQRRAERAIRDRQLVERLRDRRREEHGVRMRREEIREFDEVAAGTESRRRAIG